MNTIASVPPDPTHRLGDGARTLFRHYGDFLRATQACGTFNFKRYEEETAALPASYTNHRGEVLLAVDTSGEAVACIAYRAMLEDATGSTCEFKRLFVLPTARGHDLARRLITEVLKRTSAAGFTHILIDTDAANMPGAMELYLEFGFTEYRAHEGTIAFLKRELPFHPDDRR